MIEDPLKGHAGWPLTRFRGYTDAGLNSADQSLLYAGCGNSVWTTLTPTGLTLLIDLVLNEHSLNKGFLWRTQANSKNFLALERSALGMSVLNLTLCDSAGNAMVRTNFKPPGLTLNRRHRIMVSVDMTQSTAAAGVKAYLDDTPLTIGVSGGTALWPATTDELIGLATPGTGFQVFGTDSGGSVMGDYGAFWLAPVALDITQQSMRDLFFADTIDDASAASNPNAYKGGAPLGGGSARPLVYLSGDDAGWKTGTNGDGTPLNKGYVGASLARQVAYTVGQLVENPTAPGRWLRCTTAGTTAATQLAGYSSVADNATVTDGTAVFTSAFRFQLRQTAAARANSTAYTFAATTLITATGSSLWFRCTTAGTSAVSQPAGYASATVGQYVSDGGAVFVAIEPATTRVSSAAALTSTVPAYPVGAPTGMPTSMPVLSDGGHALITNPTMTFGDDFICSLATSGPKRFMRGDPNDPNRRVRVGTADVAPNWGYHFRQFEGLNLPGVNPRNNTAGRQFYVRPGGDTPIDGNDFLTGTIEPGVLECHQLQLNDAGTDLHPNGVMRLWGKPIPPPVRPLLRKGALSSLSAFGPAGQVVDFTCAGAIMETNTWFGFDCGYYETRVCHGRAGYPDTNVSGFQAVWGRAPFKGRVNQGKEIDIFEVLAHTPPAEPGTVFRDGSAADFLARNMWGGGGGPNDPSGPEVMGPWYTMGVLILPDRIALYRNRQLVAVKNYWTATSPANPITDPAITKSYEATVARQNATQYYKTGGNGATPFGVVLVQGRSYFCTTSGITASSEPAAYATATNPGDQVTDGTAVFTLAQDAIPFIYLIANMAMDGGFGFPNDPDGSVGKTDWSKMYMDLDYIVVFQGQGHRYITGYQPSTVTTLQ